MKCPNPLCENTALGEDYAFCFKCGCEILKAKESTSVDDKNRTPATNVEDSDVQEGTDVSLGKSGEYKIIVNTSWTCCY